MSTVLREQMGTLYGVISSLREQRGTLYGAISSPKELSATVSTTTLYDKYQGSYEVTPKVTSQKLDTAGAHLTQDIVVLSIPIYEVDNNYDGQTIIIGG